MSHDIDGARYSDRLKRAAEARQALLAQFRPRPTVTDPTALSRADLKARELREVRARRAEARTSRKLAALQALEDASRLEAAQAASALEAKRGERKERKALTKAEAQAKRDARYAARKARQ